MTSPTVGKPYPSWTWVENELGDGFWDAPKPMPTENKKIYTWNEEILEWVEVSI
jgi:hypothetical protein